MKTLIVMRHAKSSWAENGVADHDRPLNDRGKEDAKQAGKLLRDFSEPPVAVLCSTATRARKTAKRVLRHAGLNLEITLVPELYLAPASTIETVLQQQGTSDSLLIVGHNPGLSDFVSILAGVRMSMTTSAFVQFKLEIDSWHDFLMTSPAEVMHAWSPSE